jgi:hypothetical protein
MTDRAWWWKRSSRSHTADRHYHDGRHGYDGNGYAAPGGSGGSSSSSSRPSSSRPARAGWSGCWRRCGGGSHLWPPSCPRRDIAPASPPGARWSAFSSDPYFGCPRGWRVARPRMTGNVAISFYCPGIPCSSCSMICLITAEIGAPFASMLTLPNSGFCPPPALGAGKHLFLQIPLSPRAAAQAPGHTIVQSGPALHVTAFAVAMGPSIPVATSTAST